MSDQAVIRHDIGQHGVLELRTVSGTIRIQGTDSSEAVVIVKGEDRALRELNVERGDGRLLVQPTTGRLGAVSALERRRRLRGRRAA